MEVRQEFFFVKIVLQEMFRYYNNVATDIPDWIIKPEPKTEATAYWQYLFARHHKIIANNRELQPADLPQGWYEVTEEEALENLKKIFFK